jgi:hypothetical protein
MHQRILVAGYSHDPSTNSDVAVVPYTEDGARDMTFGAGASHTSGSSTGADFALTRYDGAGSVMQVNIDIQPSSYGRVQVVILASFSA